MDCECCNVKSFKLDGAEQNGKPVTNGGLPVGSGYSGQTNGEPTWKVATTPQSVFGLMAWELFAWGGYCIDEGEFCEEIYGCGGQLTLKFMLQVPKGAGADVDLTDPNGNTVPHGTPRPLPGNDTVDNYRIDFHIDMGDGCGKTATVLLDKNWVITINGVAATHHTASGDIKFELECEPCECPPSDAE